MEMIFFEVSQRPLGGRSEWAYAVTLTTRRGGGTRTNGPQQHHREQNGRRASSRRLSRRKREDVRTARTNAQHGEKCEDVPLGHAPTRSMVEEREDVPLGHAPRRSTG